MINFSLVKYVLVCAFLFSSVPLKSYALGCDYNKDYNAKITSVEVDQYNNRLWVYATDVNQITNYYLVDLKDYKKESMVMTLANTALLFGYKVNACYYGDDDIRDLYSLEVLR